MGWGTMSVVVGNSCSSHDHLTEPHSHSINHLCSHWLRDPFRIVSVQLSSKSSQAGQLVKVLSSVPFLSQCLTCLLPVIPSFLFSQFQETGQEGLQKCVRMASCTKKCSKAPIAVKCYSSCIDSTGNSVQKSPSLSRSLEVLTLRSRDPSYNKKDLTVSHSVYSISSQLCIFIQLWLWHLQVCLTSSC